MSHLEVKILCFKTTIDKTISLEITTTWISRTRLQAVINLLSNSSPELTGLTKRIRLCRRNLKDLTLFRITVTFNRLTIPPNATAQRQVNPSLLLLVFLLGVIVRSNVSQGGTRGIKPTF